MMACDGTKELENTIPAPAIAEFVMLMETIYWDVSISHPIGRITPVLEFTTLPSTTHHLNVFPPHLNPRKTAAIPRIWQYSILVHRIQNPRR